MKILGFVLIMSRFLIFVALIYVMNELLWSKLKQFFVHKWRDNIFSEPIYGFYNIYFLESSCMLNGDGKPGIPLNPRQACAVESAARSNPQAKIYVLHTCHVGHSDINLSSIYVQKTLEYSNVHIWPLNLSNLLWGTPLEHWPKPNELPSNMLKHERASDIIKFGVLWKYAGTYFDLDVIVMKSLVKMKNFASVEYSKSFSTGVVNLASDSLGNSVASECITHLKNRLFDPVLGHHGVEVLTRVLLNMCNKKLVSQLAPDCCQGFTILNTSSFPSIPSCQLGSYFYDNVSPNIVKDISDSLAVYILDSKSQGVSIEGNSNESYLFIAQKYCPEVYIHYSK